jgi:hypothetical protein
MGLDTLRRTCVFASGAICGSHSAFRGIQSVKFYALFFMLGWARCGSHKSVRGHVMLNFYFFIRRDLWLT